MSPRAAAAFLRVCLALALPAALAAACNGNVIIDEEAPVECEEGLSECGGECVDVSSHFLHCGGCDTPCFEGQCSNGVCEFSPGCPPNLGECGGDCVDIFNDPNNCGSCKNACQKGAVCFAGECAIGECVCNNVCSLIDLGSTVPQSFQSETAGTASQVVPSCGGPDGVDTSFRFFTPQDGEYTFDTFGSTFDTVLQILGEGCNVLACNDNVEPGGASQITVKLPAKTQVLAVVDAPTGGGMIQLNIALTNQPCVGCAEYITAPEPGQQLCEISKEIYGAYFTCMCSGPCSMACIDNCEAGKLSPECKQCVTDDVNGCGAELNECANDF